MVSLGAEGWGGGVSASKKGCPANGRLATSKVRVRGVGRSQSRVGREGGRGSERSTSGGRETRITSNPETLQIWQFLDLHRQTLKMRGADKVEGKSQILKKKKKKKKEGRWTRKLVARAEESKKVLL